MSRLVVDKGVRDPEMLLCFDLILSCQRLYKEPYRPARVRNQSEEHREFLNIQQLRHGCERAVLYAGICICDCSNCLSGGAQQATVNPGPTEELNRFTVRCSL